MIRVENLDKVYKNGALQVQALFEVNLSIQTGEFVAIMGPSSQQTPQSGSID